MSTAEAREHLRQKARDRRNANRINISEPLKQIADLLGVKYERVARFEITPAEVRATCWEDNEAGIIQITDDGWARMYEVRKDVRT